MILENSAAIVKQLNDKVIRRVLSHSAGIMLVEFTFNKGGVGEMHKHDQHEQVGYVAQGSFEIVVGDEKRIAKKGDSYYAAKNVLHGVVALEDNSILVDAFTPMRQDFLE